MLIDHPRILTQYRALRLPPGTPVHYHGTVKSLRGEYTVQPCICHHCMRDVEKGIPAERYALYQKGSPDGPYHVRHTSVTPRVGAREEVKQWLCEELTETYVTRLIRQEFPTIRSLFVSVEEEVLYIAWAGQPRETEMRTITVPCMANYAEGEISAVPLPVSMCIAGVEFSGIPKVSRIETGKSTATC
ncbi:hypothetical protein H3146_26705 [Streptomyces sp. OF3]|uniref:Uncharacterized protein n=1 Tax=Streptomyces alkaliterrae TaxID=2213162 RepID=A0A7W3ZQL7_9ACTN|nr:hypothetical protein [Streptomyces alkaliterrae]MBB1256903.1 hypothetical protein [Streptomyces alkaliterrae]